MHCKSVLMTFKMFTVFFDKSNFLIILLMACGQCMLVVTNKRLIPPCCINIHFWYMYCIRIKYRLVIFVSVQL